MAANNDASKTRSPAETKNTNAHHKHLESYTGRSGGGAKRGFVPLQLLLLLVPSGQARNIGHGLLSTGPRRQMQCRVLLYHETPLLDL